MMHYEIFTLLEKVALSNSCDVKMAAAIVRRGRIIALGMNSNKSHPFQAKYGKNEDAIYPHAEIAAIKNALRDIDVDELEKCDIFVLRLKKTKPFSKKWVWGLAKPCAGCQRAIAEFGLKNVYYTTDKEDTWDKL